MKPISRKHKVTGAVVGATIGAAIAGPAGAVAGGLAGSQAAAHASRGERTKPAAQRSEEEASDPLVHVEAKRMLVPLDFSPPSHSAMRFACEWAKRFGSEVYLLHVIEPMNTYGVLGPEIAWPLQTGDIHQPVQAELERLARNEFSDGIKVFIHLRDGVAYDQIVQAATDLNADLIVIATHGRSGLSHAFMGSTAERVVRHAPCPVLTLRLGRKRSQSKTSRP